MIVQAVGIATLNEDRSPENTAIADAMLKAVKRAQAEGVSDQNEIRARILAARDKLRR
jgi:hypothetical protein